MRLQAGANQSDFAGFRDKARPDLISAARPTRRASGRSSPPVKEYRRRAVWEPVLGLPKEHVAPQFPSIPAACCRARCPQQALFDELLTGRRRPVLGCLFQVPDHTRWIAHDQRIRRDIFH